MKLIIETNQLNEYLKCTDIIDFNHEEIRRMADKLAVGKGSDIDVAKEIYEFVRDEIHHSGDINEIEITLKASEVLQKKHGICCAKSHLLAALLRYKGIPTGFCYQVLHTESEGISYKEVHGLNAVYIKQLSKWIRLDARGNKEGVHAEFSTGEEKLAWPVDPELGEVDVPVVFVNPNPTIVCLLSSCKTRNDLHTAWVNEAYKAFI